MERRSEPRFDLSKPARLTVLGERGVTQDVEIANLSGRGMRLMSAEKVKVNSAVRIDVDDALLLGEVAYAQPEGERWAIGVELEHSLMHVASLRKLMSTLLSLEGEMAQRETDQVPEGGDKR